MMFKSNNTTETRNTKYDIYFSDEFWSQQTIEEKELIASQYASKQLGEEVNVNFDLNISDSQTNGNLGFIYDDSKKTLYVKKDIVNNPEIVKNTIDSYINQWLTQANKKFNETVYETVKKTAIITGSVIIIFCIICSIKTLINFLLPSDF